MSALTRSVLRSIVGGVVGILVGVGAIELIVYMWHPSDDVQAIIGMPIGAVFAWAGIAVAHLLGGPGFFPVDE